jgi:hypothetical protein
MTGRRMWGSGSECEGQVVWKPIQKLLFRLLCSLFCVVAHQPRREAETNGDCVTCSFCGGLGTRIVNEIGLSRARQQASSRQLRRSSKNGVSQDNTNNTDKPAEAAHCSLTGLELDDN